MNLESMSKNTVTFLFELIKNEGLCRLLVNNDSTPFTTIVDNKTDLINPASPNAKIHPFPFDPDATTVDGSFIRVYYNKGTFNENEIIVNHDVIVDVIVARSLWLISDNKISMIRPYEIMGRVIDMLGEKSVCPNKLKFEGFQHLYVNTKFDCLRLYATDWSVET